MHSVSTLLVRSKGGPPCWDLFESRRRLKRREDLDAAHTVDELLWQASTWAVVEGGTVVVCKKHAKYEPLQALEIDPSADQWLQKQAGGPTSPHTKL